MICWRDISRDAVSMIAINAQWAARERDEPQANAKRLEAYERKLCAYIWQNTDEVGVWR